MKKNLRKKLRIPHPLLQFLIDKFVHKRLQGLGGFEDAASDLRVGCNRLL